MKSILFIFSLILSLFIFSCSSSTTAQKTDLDVLNDSVEQTLENDIQTEKDFTIDLNDEDNFVAENDLQTEEDLTLDLNDEDNFVVENDLQTEEDLTVDLHDEDNFVAENDLQTEEDLTVDLNDEDNFVAENDLQTEEDLTLDLNDEDNFVVENDLQTEEDLTVDLDNETTDADVDVPIYDIIFYSGANCLGSQAGKFNSHTNTTVGCLTNPSSLDKKCKDNVIKSVKIMPGVKKDVDIYAFSKNLPSPNFYNNSWAVINTGKKDLTKPICISSFEQETTTDMQKKGLAMFYKNISSTTSYLDGKISKIRITDKKYQRILFYSQDSCSGALAGYFDSSKITYKKCGGFTNNLGQCENNEINSALIMPGTPKNSIIKLYDSPTGSLSHPWFFINRGKDDLPIPVCVTLYYSGYSQVGYGIYRYGDNATANDVSYLKITKTKDTKVVFYDGESCNGSVVGLFDLAKTTDDYTTVCDTYNGNGTCENNAAYSMLIQPGVLKGKDIKIFDRDDFTTGDDYATIHRGQKTLDIPFCIKGFEHNTDVLESKAGISIYYHQGYPSVQDGLYLNKKVSSIKIGDNL